MSKSSGNVRDPVSYERVFGHDVLRYFLMREVVYGLDGDFSEERLIERYNADLANDLGNLTSRVLSMVMRYSGGEVSTAASLRKASDLIPAGLQESFAAIQDLPAETIARVDQLDFKGWLEAIWSAIDICNKYIVVTAPFNLAKDPANADTLAWILANLLEALRVIAGVLEPFMPETAGRIARLLNADESIMRSKFGEGLKPGHRVNPPVALFPRIDKPAQA
jgi:methionyl-tRNA synthetase